MYLIEATLKDFGQTIHIPNLQFGKKEALELDIDSVGNLILEIEEERVIIYLTRPLSFPDPKLYEKILEFCHPKEKLRIPVTPGLTTKDELAFITHFSASTFTLPNLQIAIEQLKNLHNRIANFIK